MAGVENAMLCSSVDHKITFISLILPSQTQNGCHAHTVWCVASNSAPAVHSELRTEAQLSAFIVIFLSRSLYLDYRCSNITLKVLPLLFCWNKALKTTLEKGIKWLTVHFCNMKESRPSSSSCRHTDGAPLTPGANYPVILYTRYSDIRTES